MKKATFTISTLILAILFLIPLSMNAQGTVKEEKKLEDTPNISWNKSKHVFGSIEHLKPVTAEFIFTNEADKPVAVTKVGTTCGCTAPSYTKDPIKPGEKGTIKLIYDAVAPGFFKKGAKIHFTDGSAKEVQIEGKVVVRKTKVK